MKIGICEDETIYQQEIKNLLTPFSDKISSIETFCSGESLINYYSKGHRFDIIFIDIHMKKLSGMDAAEYIRTLDSSVVFVIVTSLIEYAIKGYSIQAYDFILKPIDTKKFTYTFSKIISSFSEKKKKIYMVENRNEKIILQLNEIMFMESFGRKLRIHTENTYFEHGKSISLVENLYSNSGFVRCHKSYLVNLKNISKIKALDIVMKNGTSIPLSAKRHKYVYDRFMTFMIEE